MENKYKYKKMNKKGEILARDWIIAAILFSGIIGLFVLGLQDMASDYGNTNVTNPEFSESFDKFDDNTELVQSMWNQSTGEGGLTTIGTFDILFKATFGVISLVFNSVTLVGGQMFSFVEFFGVPSEVGFLFFTILLSILTVVIIFIVISSVSRRDL